MNWPLKVIIITFLLSILHLYFIFRIEYEDCLGCSVESLELYLVSMFNSERDSFMRRN